MNQTINERDIGQKKKLMLLSIIPMAFLITGVLHGLFVAGPVNMLTGFKDITFSPTILITDFLQVGGLSSTFINVAIVGFFNIYLLHLYRLKINGVLIAAFFTLIGFSFFGKNVYNIIPIYLGGYYYVKYQKISFKDIIVVIMFATALSPLVSELSFAGLMHPVPSVIVGQLVGILIGFIIVPLSSHMMKFHEGFNLYNIGFTSGIIGTVLTSLLRSLGITIEPVSIIFRSNHIMVIILLVMLCIGLIILGLYMQVESLKHWPRVFGFSGRLVTDFTYLVGYGPTFINMGIMGALSLAYVIIMGGVVNGPVLAGIFTVIGFSAFGKHLKNTLPVALGVIIAAMAFGYDLSSTGIIISVLFSTTLVPIAGTHGAVLGFFAGVLHMIVVTNIGVVHGGINLYNNGFSGGVVAGVMVPAINAFRKE